MTITNREAIPLRALPFMTAWTLSPDAVALELAERSHTRRLAEGLRAYRLSAGGDPIEMQPKEWDMVVDNLKALAARLDAAGMSPDERYAVWRHDSILCLPPGVFLWLDEFEGAFFGGREVWTIEDERPGDREYSTVPLIPNELHEAVMERVQTKGPGDQPKPAAGESIKKNSKTWPYHHDTELLEHARWVIETYWEGANPDEVATKEIVVEKLMDRGLSRNAAEAVDLVTRHDSRRQKGRPWS